MRLRWVRGTGLGRPVVPDDKKRVAMVCALCVGEGKVVQCLVPVDQEGAVAL